MQTDKDELSISVLICNSDQLLYEKDDVTGHGEMCAEVLCVCARIRVHMYMHACMHLMFIYIYLCFFPCLR